MTTTIRFVIGFCEVRLRFRQLSLCVQLGDLKGRFIDREQKIPCVNQLVVFYIQLNNTSRHLWGDRNLFCAYFPVACPRRLHVIIPQPPSGKNRNYRYNDC
ncbi:Uncharacterised protein [Shigella sonnei]|nr:Uncharacterised protein [Shigella sonnei]CSF55431.1 Uncharacterised protein [Shigella sonnei]